MPTSQPQLWQYGLSIGNRCKGIPYFGGPRGDGNVNHGFRSLKEFPSKIIEIPEASEDAALLDVVKRANAKETSVFTIGCLSADVLDQPQGKRVTGYMEFALNARNLITDAVSYFQMF